MPQMKVWSVKMSVVFFICTTSVAGSKGKIIDLLLLGERSGETCSQNCL